MNKVGSSTLSYVISGIVFVSFIVFLSFAVNFEFVKSFDFAVVWEYRETFLYAAAITIGITAFAMVVGMIVGTGIAIIIINGRWYFSIQATVFVEVLRNTPLVVQLFWIHFALPLVTGISTTAVQSGIIAITLQSSAYLADIARTGIRAVPKGQYEAADALGFPIWAKWKDVILPQALRIVLPPLVSVTTDYFKATAILSLLSVGELMTQARNIAYFTHKPIEIMTFAAVLYWVLGYGVGSAVHSLGLSLSRNSDGGRNA